MNKSMDKVIQTHFGLEKKNRVRKGIVPGNSGSLWKAVSIAKNIGTSEIPELLHLEGVAVEGPLVPDTFAKFFQTKIDRLMNGLMV